MIEIERLIDKEYMDEIDGIPRTNSVINNTNRQYVVNYLVYLEGLAPLVLNGTLKLEVIDDLMSYRFFLAVNNPEIQKKHLFVFPDDYRGCFKLYKAWKAYRIAHGREILQAQYSLDHWHDFDLYANDTNSGKIEIEKGASVKSYEDIAAIMFGADPYIFPAAFSRLTIAKTVLPEFFADVNGPFGSNNMYIAESDGRLAGVLCFFDKDTKCGMDYRDLKGKYAILPNSYIYTCENYFEKILNNIYSEPDNSLYLHSFCVASNFRDRGIGKQLLVRFIEDYSSKDMYLHVLENNEAAIKLYKDVGFVIEKSNILGFSANPNKRPKCLLMLRRGQN